MKLKIMLFSMLAAIAPQFSQAISIGSISDAISNNTSIPGANTKTVKNVQAPEKSNDENKNQQPIKQSVNVPQTENHLPNPALFIEDAAMTAYIHSQLLFMKIPSVSVTTENAVVSLNGTVDTQEQANRLVKVAAAVKGVKAVNTDHLVVREKINA